MNVPEHLFLINALFLKIPNIKSAVVDDTAALFVTSQNAVYYSFFVD